MAVFAHPDDESLGMGATLAKYAAEGVGVYLVCATRGERGWRGLEEEHPGPEAVGRVREAELRAAAGVLGVREVAFLGYPDGGLDRADPREATWRLVGHLRRVRPEVVVTFSPDGHTGHPDHIAVSQLTCGAVVCAADSSYPDPQPPHRVQKLYYLVDSLELVEWARQALGDIGMTVDGVRRPHTGWADWAITTRVDATAHWRAAWEAIQCHRSQSHTLARLRTLAEATHERVWGWSHFYRVFSLVNGGRVRESDLFEGLREAH
ncbi:PIG-L deacetylase family protein [Calidithermus chliarophilus]|uniref:PIG-L deacetylase family protein n=1 Tax=Calidithermus chliarophilus TaxID=52023 RepID=UPI000687A859|nr:PIG-L deacetylase family protein [Calidithermus chliarophilus]